MFEYKTAPRFLPFQAEQIWEAKENMEIYSRLSEYEHDQIKDYLPEKPKVIADFGCGLGRAAIYLNHIYNDPSIMYVLADRTGYTENTGAFRPEKDEYYNDLKLTEEFCILNGIKNLRTFDTEVDCWDYLPRMDFINSRCSFGMHVPIERYMDRIYRASSDDCTMIFGTRSIEYNENSFKTLFKEVIFLKGNNSYEFPRQDWLILRGKK